MAAFGFAASTGVAGRKVPTYDNPAGKPAAAALPATEARIA